MIRLDGLLRPLLSLSPFFAPLLVSSSGDDLWFGKLPNLPRPVSKAPKGPHGLYKLRPHPIITVIRHI